jgi:polar amino acid transport system substrate-binding protein
MFLRRDLFTLSAAPLALASVISPAAAQTSNNTLQRIIQEKLLRVGVAQFKPFVFKDLDTGKLRGFEIDAAQRLAEDLGVELQVVEASFQTLIAGLQSGQYDIVMSSTKRTIQRALAVNFTDPYISLTDYAVVRDGAGFNSWADLDKAGIRLTSVQGGAAHLKLVDAQTKYVKAATVAPMKELNLAGLAVMTGQADAWVDDIVSISTFTAANPSQKFKMIDVPFTGHGEGNGAAARKGDYDLINVLNIFIEKQKNYGFYKGLARTYGLPETILVRSFIGATA